MNYLLTKSYTVKLAGDSGCVWTNYKHLKKTWSLRGHVLSYNNLGQNYYEKNAAIPI